MSRVSLEPRKVQALITMPPLKCKKEMQSFLGIVNYLHRLTSVTAEVGEPPRKCILVKTQWTWNGIYWEWYEWAKNIIKKDTIMKFYDASKTLYLETDASAISLRTSFLQVRDEVPNNTALHLLAFMSKILSSIEQWYSSIGWEAFGIVHCLEKFHHYCFTKEVIVIKDHKPLVTMVSKDITTLSWWLQHIMLHIHQYTVYILYKPVPDLHIADWLSCDNHNEGNDQEIAGINIKYTHSAQQQMSCWAHL